MTRIKKLWADLGIPADYVRTRGMPRQREAKRLVSIGRAPDDGKVVRLAPRAALAWHRMRRAAALAGVELLPLSGYRSVARQARVVRRKLATGETIGEVLRWVAAPGCSEHHTGRALDIGAPEHCSLDLAFERTREFRWLCRHAGRFGFTLSYPRRHRSGIGYEPWHWCWHA